MRLSDPHNERAGGTASQATMATPGTRTAPTGDEMTSSRATNEDSERVAAVKRLEPTGPKALAAFERIAYLTRLLLDVPQATVHFIGEEQPRLIAASSDAPLELEVFISICQHTLAQRQPLYSPDLRHDALIGHPLPTAQERVRFVASAPLWTREGQVVGALCATADQPRSPLTDQERTAFEELAGLAMQVVELRLDQQSTEDDLWRALQRDPLTGLLNRRGLMVTLQQQIDAAPADDTAVCLIELGLDQLALVKRGYGSQTSNQLLREAAERLRDSAQPNELVALLPDETFVIAEVAVGPTDADADAYTAERAVTATRLLGEPFHIAGEPFRFDVRAGVARAGGNEADAEVMLDTAYEAALRAQPQANEAIAWADRTAATSYRQRVSLEARLRQAIAEDAFSLAFQPVVELRDQHEPAFVGAEALLRWHQEPGQPGIGPERFVPIIEELGLMQSIGPSIVRQACELLNRLPDQADGTRRWLSLNLSPVQLRDPNLAAQLIEHTEAYAIDPRRIKLEITESALIDRFDEVAPVIKDLAASGFTLVLDDFGTGHSSLSRLINLPFEILKLDRSFVWDSPYGQGAAVVETLPRLAARLGMTPLAEGVETADHECFLKAQGYPLAQGFHYARPMPADALAQWEPSNQGVGPSTD